MWSSIARRKSLVVTVILILGITIVYKYAFTLPTTSPTTPYLTSETNQQTHLVVNNLLEENVSTNNFTKPKQAIIEQPYKTHQDLLEEKTDSSKTKYPNITSENYFIEDCDHFTDWPSPSNKNGCDKLEYNLDDTTVSAIIYMKDDLDSFPVQTFLSIVQFTKESRVTISNIVLAFLNNSESHDGHMTNMAAIKKITTSSLDIMTTSAISEWKAKQQAVQLAKSDQVFIADDTVIVNRGFINPLLHFLKEHPRALIVPHVDSLLPSRIYVSYEDKKLHPDALIWQETSISTYHVAADMKMVRKVHKGIKKLPDHLPSGGLNGETLVGKKQLLSSLLSKMKTEEPAELSLLSYMCADGVIVTKCSVAVRSNNYYITAPKTIEKLQHLYPLSDTNPDRQTIEGCAHVDSYFNKVGNFVEQT